MRIKKANLLKKQGINEESIVTMLLSEETLKKIGITNMMIDGTSTEQRHILIK